VTLEAWAGIDVGHRAEAGSFCLSNICIHAHTNARIDSLL
jgi:hypothetical protein